VPSNWKVLRLLDLCEIVLGGTPSHSNPSFWTDGAIPWINSSKVNDLRVVEPSELITEEALARSATKIMPAGTILVAITGATLGQVSSLVSPMCGNQSVVGIWDKQRERNEYLYRYIRLHIGRLIGGATGGAQQHINKGNVEEFRILAPPGVVMRRYMEIANPIAANIGITLRTNTKLRASRDLILPKLISGEIDVSRAERAVEQAAAE
jgi:type I restriction enzyme, S subunit